MIVVANRVAAANASCQSAPARQGVDQAGVEGVAGARGVGDPTAGAGAASSVPSGPTAKHPRGPSLTTTHPPDAAWSVRAACAASPGLVGDRARLDLVGQEHVNRRSSSRTSARVWPENPSGSQVVSKNVRAPRARAVSSSRRAAAPRSRGATK